MLAEGSYSESAEQEEQGCQRPQECAPGCRGPGPAAAASQPAPASSRCSPGHPVREEGLQARSVGWLALFLQFEEMKLSEEPYSLTLPCLSCPS